MTITKLFGDKFRAVKNSEAAELMPAAIITSIVSSILLLGIAGSMSLVLRDKASSEKNVNLTSIASNIDISLRSDITKASTITALTKLKQPSGRLLTPADVFISGVSLHIPESEGRCKVVNWSLYGSKATREMAIYSGFSMTGATAKCDISSTIEASRTKTFATNTISSAPFRVNNQVGRELAFTLSNEALVLANTALDTQLIAKEVTTLDVEDFNELNKLLNSSSFQVAFADPDACPMNVSKITSAGLMVCPAAETDTIAAAWNSTKVAKVGVSLELSDAGGEKIARDIVQNSSVPLYSTGIEARAAVASSNLSNRPAAPVITLPNPVVTLGANFTINWTAGGNCLADMARTYKLYENDVLVSTQTSPNFIKANTFDATQNLTYTVQTECMRGALIVVSDMSAPVIARVPPVAPVSLTIVQQPSSSNAALNSPLAATAVCLYGTNARYSVIQSASSWGTAGTILTDRSSVSLAINEGFTVVQGASYQYRVEAWCENETDRSAAIARTTNNFSTLISAPSGTPAFASPANNSTNVSATSPITWSAVSCAVGTTPQYHVTKNINAGVSITPQVVSNWTSSLNVTSSNSQGSMVGYVVKSRCAGTAVTSAESSSSNVSYTTVIDKPVTAPVFTFPANNAVGVTASATLTWFAVSCPVDTVPAYYVVKNINGNLPISPQVVANWISGTSVNVNNSEGNTGGYDVEARCVGANASSVSTVAEKVKFTTLVTSPSAPVFTSPANNAVGMASNVTVSWTSVACGVGSTPKYYVTKNINDGVAITPQVISDWSSSNTTTSISNQGSTVGYTVAARCDAVNASSNVSSTSSVTFTTGVSAPSAPVFSTSPANNAVGIATSAFISWGAVSCPTGTSVRYYSTKDIDANMAITPVVMANWTTSTSFTSNNKQGYTVGYTVEARCVGANATSPSSSVSRLQYTTLVTIPSNVTASNNGAGLVTWGAVICSPDAVAEYRVRQTKSDNTVVDSYSGWVTGTSASLPTTNTSGYPQWATVQARCNGVNAASATIESANTTKWVKQFIVPFTTSMGWNRINFNGSCPVGSTVNPFYIYAGSDTWSGGTYNYNMLTDEGYSIPARKPASGKNGGTNTGWLQINLTQNTQWINTTANWGTTESGLGSRLTGNVMEGTYWNAGVWTNYGYYWYGSCSTPFMTVGVKDYYRTTEGDIRSFGDPFTRYNAASSSSTLTTAGTNSIL